MKKSFLLLLTLVVTQLLFAQPTWYVKVGGTGDGSSWVNASGDLRAVIAAAHSGDQIWVAAGTYTPTNGTDRNISFVMKNGVAIYGGFAGTETNLTDRNWKTNATILSGDIDQNDGPDFTNNNGNSYHVVNNLSLNNSAVLDGFTITAGNNGDYGGGMMNAGSSPTLTNCSFLANSARDGGGMSNRNSSPILNNCSFAGNRAGASGGGMLNFISSSPSLTNCSFSRNMAYTNNGGGGGMSSFADCSPRLTNCIFYANSAPNGVGGGMENGSSSPTLVNCTFSGNSAAHAGAIETDIYSSGTLTNCILWGDPGGTDGETYLGGDVTVNNCIIQNDFDSQDPLFVDAANGNLRLRPCSPAINAGLNSANSTTKDLDGNSRIYNGTIDMGAYEDQDVFISNVLYVNAAAPTSSGNGLSWATAFKSLQEALANACGGGIKEIWVAKGTYYPDDGGGKADNNRDASFALKNGLAIYGGFAGTETSLAERDWKTNVTILSGDIDQNDGPDFANNSGNSYHVVNNSGVGGGLNRTAVLNGFTITAGNANGSQNQGFGGGMYNFNASPTITNCIFSGNSATNGGGMYTQVLGPLLTNCTFLANSATNGGGAYNGDRTRITLINCSFSANKAINGGGGMYNQGTTANFSPTLTNCSFSANSAVNGGGMYNQSITATLNPTLTNCIFWGDTGGEIYNASGTLTVTYSIVQGGYSGTNNKDQDPLFANAASGNLHLQSCSPAIDAGNDASNGNSTDLDANPRKVDAITGGSQIDMGAYEYQSLLPTFYRDADGDGYGDPAVSIQACTKPDGYITDNTDCNDDPNSGGAMVHAAPALVTCPGNISQSTGAGQCTATVSYAVSFSGDNLSVSYQFSGATTASGTGTGSGASFNKGVTHVTVTGSNACNPTGVSCTFTVTVSDNQLPTITCPGNMVVNPTSLNGAVVNYTTPVGMDNCPGAVTTRTQGPASGTTCSIGTTTVSYQVNDADGQTTSCSFSITVRDPYYRADQTKVYVCHKGKTLVISVNALQHHLDHGDQLGSCEWYSSSTAMNSVEQLTATDTQALPQAFTLSAYPNPFNHQTQIRYSVPVLAKVSIKVYDMMGREVAQVLMAEREAGSYTETYNVSRLSSGVYYARMIATAEGRVLYSQTQKLVKSE